MVCFLPSLLTACGALAELAFQRQPFVRTAPERPSRKRAGLRQSGVDVDVVALQVASRRHPEDTQDKTCSRGAWTEGNIKSEI